MVVDGPGAPRGRRPPGRVPGDDDHRLPGRGSRPAGLLRGRVDRTACATARRLAAEGLGGIAVVTGYLDRRAGVAPRMGLPAGAPLDAAALLYEGRSGHPAKHHLPNYGVFDEYRYFVPGDPLPVFRLQADGGQVDVAIAICEDLWQDGGPVQVTWPPGRRCSWSRTPHPTSAASTTSAGAVRPPRPRGRSRARLREHDRRPGRACLRRRLAGRGRGRPYARAGSPVRGALLVADLDLPAADPAQQPATPRRGDGTVITIRRLTLPAGTRYRTAPGRPGTAAGQVGGECQDGPPGGLDEVYAALVRGTRLRAQERLRLGDPRPVRRHRLGADRDDRGRRDRPRPGARGADAEPVLLALSVSDAEDLVKRQGLHALTVPIAGSWRPSTPARR